MRLGTIFLISYRSLCPHTHNRLVHITSQDNLPRSLRCIDIVTVHPLDRHGVQFGAQFLEKVSLCHRLAAETYANNQYNVLQSLFYYFKMLVVCAHSHNVIVFCYNLLHTFYRGKGNKKNPKRHALELIIFKICNLGA